MKTYQPILTTSITAAADLTINRFIGFDGNPCAAGAKAIGVAELDAAAGEQATANSLGVILVEAGAAITVGDPVEADANACAIPLSAGANNGHALDAAAAAGDVIRILRGI
ncbi:DUF2190 domain-containing protein [Halothiobacillus diazotrophicus]|uniref:DUF2190 domain-containing protein n=1 Tax=Halothiobacillus diazotrophicus TaxID=1860122 RepID=A0A191ZDW0_9GAMM|nr:DUF2190 family protein [Halothiobacillus diazotrophicus]ANJ66055.1 DUF2190 domain-containing protein [Halothiobacillus diazotrophicus]